MKTEPKPRGPGDYIWIVLALFFISASGLFLFLLYQTFYAPLKAPTTSTNTNRTVAKSPLPDDLAVDRLIQNSARHQYQAEAVLNDALAEKLLLARSVNNDQLNQQVIYQGPVEHIFFHPLIAYPELAFDQDQSSQGYNEWFITVSEFNQILDSLYQKNYILININYLYEEKIKNGSKVISPKENLMLPEGKKPLIISIDDLNYYDYMVQNGNVHKLVLDEKGNTATLTSSSVGEQIAYDNEIVPILDEFVRQHPDFSFQGAKGTIALTGYEGILGYRLDTTDPNYEQEKSKVLALVNHLKSSGWTFASHGYGHLDAREIGYNNFVRDTSRWKQEVEPLLGPTNIYIYPFGSSLNHDDPKFQYLLDSGFQVFYGVGPNPYLKITSDYILMDRRHIDGLALHYQSDLLIGLFDSKAILDPVRPAFNP